MMDKYGSLTGAGLDSTPPGLNTIFLPERPRALWVVIGNKVHGRIILWNGSMDGYIYTT
jgi:hypothetical protein